MPPAHRARWRPRSRATPSPAPRAHAGARSPTGPAPPPRAADRGLPRGDRADERPPGPGAPRSRVDDQTGLVGDYAIAVELRGVLPADHERTPAVEAQVLHAEVGDGQPALSEDPRV